MLLCWITLCCTAVSLCLNSVPTAGPDAQTPFIMASTTTGYRWPWGNEQINEEFRKDFALLKPAPPAPTPSAEKWPDATLKTPQS